MGGIVGALVTAYKGQCRELIVDAFFGGRAFLSIVLAKSNCVLSSILCGECRGVE
jgi:hypothetical protein